MRHSLVDQGHVREYVVHLPATYGDKPTQRWPVVLAFHGRGNDAAITAAFSGLSRLPAVVVYPEGVIGDGGKRAWQGAPYAAGGVDDVLFTTRLMERLASSFCTDPQRTYVTGKSNGGGFAHLLACRLSDRVAAVGVVAAALYPGAREGCSTARPIPELFVHGTGDSTIPYAGDSSRELPAIPAAAQERARVNGCRKGARTGPLTTEATSTWWQGCTRGAQVALVTVTGGGHTWPGADDYSGGGHTTQTFEATDLIWTFLSRHRVDGPERGARA